MNRGKPHVPPGEVSSGVRAGVWLFVLALLVLGTFPLWWPGRPDPAPPSQLLSSPVSEVQSPRDLRSPVMHATRAAAEPDSFSLAAEEAGAVACRIANERALELYRCKPFTEDFPASREGSSWVWRQRRGQGKGDVEASVRLTGDGLPQDVDVLLLDNSRF